MFGVQIFGRQPFAAGPEVGRGRTRLLSVSGARASTAQATATATTAQATATSGRARVIHRTQDGGHTENNGE